MGRRRQERVAWRVQTCCTQRTADEPLENAACAKIRQGHCGWHHNTLVTMLMGSASKHEHVSPKLWLSPWVSLTKGYACCCCSSCCAGQNRAPAAATPFLLCSKALIHGT